MNSNSLLCLDTKGFHRVHYYDWGDAAAAAVAICVHGLTRNGRDFDFLAQMLAERSRVVCPDVVGRGKSDWLRAGTDYNYIQYMNDMAALMARVTRTAEQPVYWVGTSMGALLGILLASLPNSPIVKLVVNDAGPLVPKAALQRIASYVGKDLRFESYDALEAHVRLVSAPFGALTDAQWRHLTIHSTRQFDDGRWGMSYDPAIGLALQGALNDVDLWAQWDAIRCPTLVIRGAQSDILRADTAAEMTRRGPKAKLVEVPGVGHAPMLMTSEQASIVRDFLF
jgi:pimeloyl-ACP methyl ester carboxylesterase